MGAQAVPEFKFGRDDGPDQNPKECEDIWSFQDRASQFLCPWFQFCSCLLQKYIALPTLPLPGRLIMWGTLLAYLAKRFQWPQDLGVDVCSGASDDWYLAFHGWWHILIAVALFIEWLFMW